MTVVALNNYAIYRSLIIAGIETKEVGWDRGGVMLTLIKSLAVSDKVILIMQCFNCQSLGTTATVPAAD